MNENCLGTIQVAATVPVLPIGTEPPAGTPPSEQLAATRARTFTSAVPAASRRSCCSVEKSTESRDSCSGIYSWSGIRGSSSSSYEAGTQPQRDGVEATEGPVLTTASEAGVFRMGRFQVSVAMDGAQKEGKN